MAARRKDRSHLAELFVFSWGWEAGTLVHRTRSPNLWLRTVAAHSPAHLELSPIRICCLTSRLPQIGCSDLTQGSTGEKKLLKDFAAGLPLSVQRSRSSSPTLAGLAPVAPQLHPATPRLSQGTLTLNSPCPSPPLHPNSRPLLASAPGWGPLRLRRPQSSLPCGHPVGLHPAAHGLSAESLGGGYRGSAPGPDESRGRRLPAMAGAWLRWGLLLWAGLLAWSAHGRVRRITYVVRPGPGLPAGALPLAGPPRTFNVALDARYSRSSTAASSRALAGPPAERTRRTSQPGGAALSGLRSPLPPEPARPGGPGRQLQSKAGAQTAVTRFAKHGRQVVRSKVQQDTQSAGGSRLQVQQKQQLQG